MQRRGAEGRCRRMPSTCPDQASSPRRLLDDVTGCRSPRATRHPDSPHHRSVRGPCEPRTPDRAGSREGLGGLIPSPSSGHNRQTASLAVPVAGMSHSQSACAFASVTVTTALTSAASVSRRRNPGHDVDGARSTGGAPRRARRPRSDGPRPTVATATTRRRARSRRWTSTAVSIPTPGPRRPSWSASSARWTSGSEREYAAGTLALITQLRPPMPPPSGALEIARTGLKPPAQHGQAPAVLVPAGQHRLRSRLHFRQRTTGLDH